MSMKQDEITHYTTEELTLKEGDVDLESALRKPMAECIKKLEEDLLGMLKGDETWQKANRAKY